MLTEPSGAKVCVRSARPARPCAHTHLPRTRVRTHARARAYSRHRAARAAVLWRINTPTNLARFTDSTGVPKFLSNAALVPNAAESTLPSPNLCIRIERRSGYCACLNVLSDRADTWSSVFIRNYNYAARETNAATAKAEMTYTGAQPTRRRVGTATLRMRKPGRPQGVCVHGIHDGVNGQHARPAAEPVLHHQHHRRGRDGWEIR